MSFADWKKRTKLLHRWPFGEEQRMIWLAEAAYKAGERQGRKDAEAIATQAIALRNLLARNEKK